MSLRGRISRLFRLPTAASQQFASRCRSFSSHVDHVTVPCASAGSITVSIYNERQHFERTPLLLYLPPHAAAQPAPPPDFLLRQQLCPVAVVNYRWSGSALADPTSKKSRLVRPHIWPAPLHDVLFAYDWLCEKLDRPIYVYGERLGAGLAATLALTETFPHWRSAVRGLAAYNGIYRWTPFIDTTYITTETYGTAPGDIPRSTTTFTTTIAPSDLDVPSLETLFAQPNDLLDPFASPSLFFQTAGPLLLPPSFDSLPWKLVCQTEKMPHTVRQQRMLLRYPPEYSLQDIPNTLLLHDRADSKRAAQHHLHHLHHHSPDDLSKVPRVTPENNSYAAQADELTYQMRRAIRHLHWEKQNGLSDDDDDDDDDDYLPSAFSESHYDSGIAEAEDEQRVRSLSVGSDGDGIDASGQDALLSWLDEQISWRARSSAALDAVRSRLELSDDET